MKVLMINPPSEHMITTNIPSVVDEERGYNPPLGLLYVAGYAKAKTSHEITFWIAKSRKLPKRKWKAASAPLGPTWWASRP